MADLSTEFNVISDGKYGTELGRMSPEGNMYGQTRLVRSWEHYQWWTGQEYQDIEVAGRADSFAELPTGRPWGEIWQIPDANRNTGWAEYFFNAETDEWERLQWFWTVYGFSALPTPGLKIGAAHIIKESNVTVMWTGFPPWERYPKHSGILDDEPDRHLPSGFLQMSAPDVRVVYYSPREISLQAVAGGSGKVWVNGEWIEAGRSCSVFNRLAVINWNGQTKALNFAYTEPAMDYWLYLARGDEAFNFTTGLPEDETHAAAPKWDYRDRMFLSLTPNVDGYLSDEGSGKNARLVGKVETNDTGEFVRNVDISLISHTVNFPETFRNYSDYQVQFVDQDTLTLKLLDGQYGQIAINRDLYYLGSDFDIDRGDPWVDWNDADVQLDGTALLVDTTYYIYLPASIDAFNFNEVNELTGRPWVPTDQDSASHYIPTLDLRLRPFLSPKAPEHGRMDDQYPGYEARHIGMVRTDGNGKFINARDLSVIQQPGLNPTYFDGLAEISITPIGNYEFRVTRKIGTSGIVNVCGDAIQTYEQNDALVHSVTTSLKVQAYNEANLTNPLSDLLVVSSYPNTVLHLYLANHRELWGPLAGRTFLTLTPPQKGYLSRNWTGNTARWLASVLVDKNGKFTGSFLVDSIALLTLSIDDQNISVDTVFSSSRLMTEIQKIYMTINVSQAWAEEQNTGIAVSGSYSDSGDYELTGNAPETQVIFPNLSILTIPDDGIVLSLPNNGEWGPRIDTMDQGLGLPQVASANDLYPNNQPYMAFLSYNGVMFNPYGIIFNGLPTINTPKYLSLALGTSRGRCYNAVRFAANSRYWDSVPTTFEVGASNMDSPTLLNDNHWVPLGAWTDAPVWNAGLGPWFYFSNLKTWRNYRLKIVGTGNASFPYCYIALVQFADAMDTFVATMTANDESATHGQKVVATSELGPYAARLALNVKDISYPFWSSAATPTPEAPQSIMFSKGFPVAYKGLYLGLNSNSQNYYVTSIEVWGSDNADPDVDNDSQFTLLGTFSGLNLTAYATHLEPFNRFTQYFSTYTGWPAEPNEYNCSLPFLFDNQQAWLWYRIKVKGVPPACDAVRMAGVRWVPSGQVYCQSISDDGIVSYPTFNGRYWFNKVWSPKPFTGSPRRWTLDLGEDPAALARYRLWAYRSSDVNIRAFPSSVTFSVSNMASPDPSNDADWTTLHTSDIFSSSWSTDWFEFPRSVTEWRWLRLCMFGSYGTADYVRLAGIEFQSPAGKNIYLNANGTLEESLTDPDGIYPALKTLGNDKIWVGTTL